ncbi:hypothetical protein [Vibrio mexicanus]|uniref:hypothetical protein n=1 Tax=Vibrio mexicanus TaxID=1004326 RepID=UPI00063C78AD|nr:hypothetical protein [Vibrio mexicanus]
MDIQQCWSSYLKADQLLEQGYLNEAHQLYASVLEYLPTHIHNALDYEQLKPCQFQNLLVGARNCAIAQSEILNKLGKQEQAFEVIHQSYALMQFLSLESMPLVQACAEIIEANSCTLLRTMEAFCFAQRSAKWQLEFETIKQAHYQFARLKVYTVPHNASYPHH